MEMMIDFKEVIHQNPKLKMAESIRNYNAVHDVSTEAFTSFVSAKDSLRRGKTKNATRSNENAS